MVLVPGGYPQTMLDLAFLPAGSPLLGVLKGQPQQNLSAGGRTWTQVSYHPHTNGGAPPWDPTRHGFHTYIDAVDAQPTVVRMTGEVRGRLESLLFSRYPNREWACFFLFGTRRTREGLLLTIIDLLEPGEGDLDSESDIVSFSEPYTLRAALRKQDSGLSVGTIHSHPEGCWPKPSRLDDDMDGYYAEYFPLFGSSGTYFGLIFSRDEDGQMTFSE
jgi:hypothetical protein